MAAQRAAATVDADDAALIEVVLSRLLVDETQEIERVRPFAEDLARFVRARDPQATFTLQPPIDPGIWRLYAHITPPLDEDCEFSDAVTERAVDIQIEHDVSISVLPVARRDTVPEHRSGRSPKAPRNNS